jgi:Xaa-Pro aminopeptidase
MALHFTREEYAHRRKRTIDGLVKRDLDGLLMFRQESMYYLTGYDSFGYVFFQCLYPGNEFIIGSGEDAILCRYKSGRRKLDRHDQLTLEWAGVYRHYHAALMRTIPIGQVTSRHEEMYRVTMDACMAALKPGRPIGEVFDAYARTCDAAGMHPHRLNATGTVWEPHLRPTGWTGRCFITGIPFRPSPTWSSFYI